MVEMQSAKLELMRQSSGQKTPMKEEDLIISFDEVYTPSVKSDESISLFEPLGYLSIVLISIIPSFIYLIVCFFFKKSRKRS